MDLRATVFDRFDALPRGIESQWSQKAGLPFDQTPEWFHLLHEHVLKEHFESRIVVVSTQEGEPSAIVPLSFTKEPVLPFGIRQLRSMTNYYTSAFDLISLRDAQGTSAVKGFVSCIANMGTDANFIAIEPVPRNGQFFNEAAAALGDHGYIVSPYRRFSNWFHEVKESSFEQYLQLRDGALRNTYARKEKKLRKQGYELEIVSRPADVDSAIGAYDMVYRRSWKVSESHPRFIADVCRTFARRGWLRLGVLMFNGTPLAAQIWFVKDGIASIFKLSYDEDFKSLSAGTILTMALFRHVIDIDKVMKIDYLTGDDAYKRQYMSSCREMWCLRAYRKASTAALFGFVESARTALRRRLRPDVRRGAYA